MRNDAILAGGLAALLAAAGGVALYRHAPWKQDSFGIQGDSGSSVWQGPPGATAEQHLALQEHIHAGGPLPAGFTLQSEVARRFTGRVDPATGRRELELELKVPTADLEEARVYVDGALQATATRANGGLVDRPADGMCTATLKAWIAPAGRSFKVAVRWDTDPGGPSQESSFSVRVPWYREWLAKLFSG